MIGTAICMFFALLVDNLMLMTALLCLNFTFQIIGCDLLVCFITETVIEEHRGSHIMIIFISFSIGSVFNGVLFKLISWENVFIYYFIVPSLLMFIGLKWYIKETPFDLVTNFTAEEAHRDLHWIAI